MWYKVTKTFFYSMAEMASILSGRCNSVEQQEVDSVTDYLE